MPDPETGELRGTDAGLMEWCRRVIAVDDALAALSRRSTLTVIAGTSESEVRDEHEVSAGDAPA